MYKVAFAVILVGASLLVTSYQLNLLAFETLPQAQLSKEAPKLRVDQSNTFISGDLSLCNGLYGQTFVPKANNLAQVDLLLTINVLPAPGAEVQIGIFTNITGEPIETTTTFVAPPSPAELDRIVSFRFDPPIPLDKKIMYTIGFYGTETVCWRFSYGDSYPYGDLVNYTGIPSNPPADFIFTTYSLK